MLEFGFSVVGWGGVLFVGGGYLLGGGVGWGVVLCLCLAVVSGCSLVVERLSVESLEC